MERQVALLIYGAVWRLLGRRPQQLPLPGRLVEVLEGAGAAAVSIMRTGPPIGHLLGAETTPGQVGWRRARNHAHPLFPSSSSAVAPVPASPAARARCARAPHPRARAESPPRSAALSSASPGGWGARGMQACITEGQGQEPTCWRQACKSDSDPCPTASPLAVPPRAPRARCFLPPSPTVSRLRHAVMQGPG